MYILKLIRLSTWWFKLPPFLVLIYCYFIKTNIIDIYYEINVILFLLGGLILGAIFASFINNYYDSEGDAIAGKENFMGKLNKTYQLLALGSIILSGLIYSLFLLDNTLAFLFYWMGWLCFYLYSSKQFRLKEKTYLGIITDGLGSQFFPSLFIFTYLFNGNIANNITFMISGSVWMLCAFGMRALITHQYYDFDNDVKAGVVTFINSSSQKVITRFSIFVLLAECVSFLIFIGIVDWTIFIFSFSIYILSLLLLRLLFKVKLYFFQPFPSHKCRSLLFDYYITILPVIILLFLTLKNGDNILLLLASVLLFNISTFFGLYSFIKTKSP